MTDPQSKYVAGFLFDTSFFRVILIEKNRPDWQKGKLNAVGGKIEEGETPAQAMRREFLEECGVDIPDWIEFAVLSDMRDYRVSFFYSSGDLSLIRQMEDEWPDDYSIDSLPKNCIPNLHWLIPMAAHIGDDNADRFLITEYARATD